MTDPGTEPGIRVAVVSPVHPDLLGWLRARSRVHYVPDAGQDDLRAAAVAGSDILVLRSNVRLGSAELTAMRRLRLVLRAGSGTDNLDLLALRDHRVELVRVGGAHSAPAVAELALQATIGLLRRVPAASAELSLGRWSKAAVHGEELAGRTVGIWGAGPVGHAVAILFGLLGTKVVFAEYPSVPDRFRQAARAELASMADVHVFALPKRADTVGYVDTELLDLFRRRRPHLVNVGRWDLFDMPGVIEALSQGHLSGVAVDPLDRAHVATAQALLARFTTPDRPLNLQLTPHLGAMTTGSLRRVAAAAIAELDVHWGTLRATADR
jgi:D-3-phosphoglycerate dehydrogenase